MQGSAAGGGVRWLPLVLLLFLGLLWGSNPSFSKALVNHGLSPASVVFWQTLGAGVLLSLVCLARRIAIPVSRRALLYYAVIGVVGIDGAYMMLVFSVKHLTVGFMSVLILFSPLLTYVIAVLLRLERISAMRGFGILIGFAGAGVLVFPEGSLPSPDLMPFALLGFLVPTGYAISNVYAEWGRPAAADNVALAAGTMFAAATGAFAFSLLDASFHPVWAEFAQRETILFGFSLVTAVSFLVFYLIITLAGAVYLGQVGYIVTLAGVGWGVLFFGETTPVWLWAAIAIVGIGVGFVNFGKARRA